MPTAARRAEFALLAVTLVWGLSFPLIKGGLESSPPFSFLALRFGLGFLLVLPFLGGRVPPRSTWGPGLGLALFIGLSYYAQTLGLVHTSSTRSAFITGLSVVLVPLLYPAITRRPPGFWPSAAALVAAAGLYLITGPGGGGGMNRGDLLTLLCALGYALYVVVLEVQSRRHDYRALLAVQMAVLGVAFAPAALLEGGPTAWTPRLLVAVVGTAFILAVSMVLQNRYQKDTTAPRAAVIYTAEPVFASLFAYLLLRETLAPIQGAGGALILGALLLSGKR